MSKWPEYGYGPKAKEAVASKKCDGDYSGLEERARQLDADFRRYNRQGVKWPASGFVFDDYVNLPDPDLIAFANACKQTGKPIPLSHWNSLPEFRQRELMERCRIAAKSSKPKHEGWRRLWGTYSVAKVTTTLVK